VQQNQTPASATIRRRNAESNRDPEFGIEMANQGVNCMRDEGAVNCKKSDVSARFNWLPLDPLNSWNFAALGDVHWTAGRFAEAEAAYRKAVELGPTTSGLHALLANIFLSTHNAADAIAEAEREPDAEWRATALLFALDAAGRKTEADRAVASYELKYAYDDPGGIAAFYACRHDTERTNRWLSRFLAKHEGEYHGLPNREACFANVESDSNYKALRQKLKLPSSAEPAP
jgi:tetratricopeptide (TPR) repeat protein